MTVAIAAVCGFVLAFLWASFFEWTLHKYVMHRPFLGLRYPFHAHALTHHRIFDWDDSYFLQPGQNKDNVTFAWWNFPLLLTLNAPVFVGGAMVALGGFGPAFWGAFGGAMVGMAGYYGLYESLHWCMHVPGERWFMKTRWFKYIQAHHRMHHKRPNSNLNVVFPLADFILGTKLPGLTSVEAMAEAARLSEKAKNRQPQDSEDLVAQK